MTPRTRVIFGPPGHAYIYLIYGMYECLNIVTEPDGEPGCVLIRGLAPLRGIELMQSRRRRICRIGNLMNGPGKLTQAMGITRALGGSDLTLGPLFVLDDGTTPENIDVTPRIGITQCVDWPLRFVERSSPFVSRRVLVPNQNQS